MIIMSAYERYRRGIVCMASYDIDTTSVWKLAKIKW